MCRCFHVNRHIREIDGLQTVILGECKPDTILPMVETIECARVMLRIGEIGVPRCDIVRSIDDASTAHGAIRKETEQV